MRPEPVAAATTPDSGLMWSLGTPDMTGEGNCHETLVRSRSHQHGVVAVTRRAVELCDERSIQSDKRSAVVPESGESRSGDDPRGPQIDLAVAPDPQPFRDVHPGEQSSDVSRDLVGGELADHHHRRERQRHADRRGIADQHRGPAVQHVVVEAHDRGGERGSAGDHTADDQPAAAPTAVSPRHQMPSTSSGHSVDAATANTSPTLRDSSRDGRRQRQRDRHAAADHGGQPEVADPAAQHVGGQRTGDADQQARRGRQERGDRAGGHQRGQQLRRPSPPIAAPRQQQHRGVGGAGDQQLRHVQPGEHPEQRREQVEQRQQRDHRQRGAPRRPAVGVGVEAHQHVRQPHGAQEGRRR